MQSRRSGEATVCNSGTVPKGSAWANKLDSRFYVMRNTNNRVF